MFSPSKISWVVSGMKYICLQLLPVFYLIQPSSKQIICFDFRKQNSVLPTVLYVPWKKPLLHKGNFFLNIFIASYVSLLCTEVRLTHLNKLTVEILDKNSAKKF
jgi:hypothetical protein